MQDTDRCTAGQEKDGKTGSTDIRVAEPLGGFSVSSVELCLQRQRQKSKEDPCRAEGLGPRVCRQMQNGNHPSCLPTPGAGVKVNGLVFLLSFSSRNILAPKGLTRSPSDLPSPRCCTTCTPQHKSWSWLGPLGSVGHLMATRSLPTRLAESSVWAACVSQPTVPQEPRRCVSSPSLCPGPYSSSLTFSFLIFIGL